MKVLITGASGFIGSNVLEYLLARTDWKFVCLSSFRHKGSQHNLPDNERVEVKWCDLRGEIPEIGDFDYILNLASESHVDRSISDPVNFIENNVALMLQMLEYARKHPPKVFLQFSTDEVYGDIEHEEWSVLRPANPYSASKACQEMICFAYWRTFGVPVVITNSNNIIGKNQDKEKVVPKFIDLIRNGEEVTIHTVNGQPGSRVYNPVNNVADALLYILKYRKPRQFDIDPLLSEPQQLDRYNLPGGTELDNYSLAWKIADLMGKELKFKTVDVNKVRPGYDTFYPKTDGRLTQMGWKPQCSFEDELRELVK